jgi:hypothetical protein
MFSVLINFKDKTNLYVIKVVFSESDCEIMKK